MPDCVRLGQAAGDLAREVEQLLDGEASRLEPVLEGLALDQLHRDEARALVLADLVDRGDVRMVEGRRGTGLSFEAAKPPGVVRHLLGQHLDRDLAAEARVARAVDLAHPS